jgi:hypothetical protein
LATFGCGSLRLSALGAGADGGMPLSVSATGRCFGSVAAVAAAVVGA